jgi:hypothetical protein
MEPMKQKKPILMVKNDLNDDFLSHYWNPMTPLSNHELKNNTNKLLHQNCFFKIKEPKCIICVIFKV